MFRALVNVFVFSSTLSLIFLCAFNPSYFPFRNNEKNSSFFIVIVRLQFGGWQSSILIVVLFQYGNHKVQHHYV